MHVFQNERKNLLTYFVEQFYKIFTLYDALTGASLSTGSRFAFIIIYVGIFRILYFLPAVNLQTIPVKQNAVN